MAYSPDFVPASFRPGADAAASAMRNLDNVLIAGHVNPDGDAIGSMAAAGYILQALGRKFEIYTPKGIPGYLDFLALPCPVFEDLGQLQFAPESAVYVDCSEPARLGPQLESVWNSWPSVNIDHHLSAGGLGSLANFIETGAAATCQLMAYVAASLKFQLAGPLADAVGLGVITDTGNFTHNNADAAVFSLCAELERNGCHLPGLGEKLRSNWTICRLRLWGELFSQVRVCLENRVAWSVVFSEDLKRYGCSSEDLEGYIDGLRRMRGVEIALTVRQGFTAGGNEISKFSLRSINGVDVQTIASRLGGGGHKNASGGTIDAPVWRALTLVLTAIENYYDENPR